MSQYLLSEECLVLLLDTRKGRVSCSGKSGACPKFNNRGVFGKDCLQDSPPPLADKWRRAIDNWSDKELKEGALELHKAINEFRCFSSADLMNYHHIMEEVNRRAIRFNYLTKLEFPTQKGDK